MKSLDSYISRKENVPWRVIEGEAILVDVGKGEVIHCNEVGASIWNFLEGKKTIEEITQHICNTFEIDKDTAQRDTFEFIQELFEKGLTVSYDA